MNRKYYQNIILFVVLLATCVTLIRLIENNDWNDIVNLLLGISTMFLMYPPTFDEESNDD